MPCWLSSPPTPFPLAFWTYCWRWVSSDLVHSKLYGSLYPSCSMQLDFCLLIVFLSATSHISFSDDSTILCLLDRALSWVVLAKARKVLHYQERPASDLAERRGKFGTSRKGLLATSQKDEQSFAPAGKTCQRPRRKTRKVLHEQERPVTTPQKLRRKFYRHWLIHSQNRGEAGTPLQKDCCCPND